MHRCAAAALAVIAAAPAAAVARDRVVLLVDNRSGNGAAANDLAPVLAQLVAGKGYEVVPSQAVAGELTPEAAQQLRESLKADAVLTVTVTFFLEARSRSLGPKASPALGLRARLFSSNGKVWRNSLGWIADDAPAPQPAIGFRKAPAPRPTAVACERLLWSMPRGHLEIAAAPAMEEIAAPAPPASSGYAAPIDRQRDFTGVAHFPLRMDRVRR